jgi:EamA-like transporter family protein
MPSEMEYSLCRRRWINWGVTPAILRRESRLFAPAWNPLPDAAFATVVWLYVLHRLPAGTTSMSSLGVPVVALVSSAIQLGERPRAAELVGMGLIATALAIVSWDTVRQHREVDPQMGQE